MMTIQVAVIAYDKTDDEQKNDATGPYDLKCVCECNSCVRVSGDCDET